MRLKSELFPALERLYPTTLEMIELRIEMSAKWSIHVRFHYFKT